MGGFKDNCVFSWAIRHNVHLVGILIMIACGRWEVVKECLLTHEYQEVTHTMPHYVSISLIVYSSSGL